MWDNNGNLLNDGSARYLYDRANRLISTTVGGTTSLFNYNGDGARLKQITAGVITTYTQDLAAPLPVVLQAKTGSATTQYLYALGTRPLAQNGGAWAYLLPDALGSVRQIVDANGNVALAESYEPYGDVMSSNGTASSIFGYSGEEVDNYIKSLFLRARYYSPETARFLSKDMWQGDYTRPQSLDGWSYTEGNPVNRTDPSGNDPWGCDTQPDPNQCYLRQRNGWKTYDRFDITLAYMYREMIRNAQSDQVASIRSELEAICSNDPFVFQYAGDYATAALSMWATMVHAGGPWDHKPILDRMLGLKQANDYYFPIRGDTEHEYYYDIWSNMHYGYVGSSAGFDFQALQSGAAAGDYIAGANDEADVLSVQIGIDLWKNYNLQLIPEQLHQAILAHTQDYLSIPGQTTVIQWTNGQ